MINDALHAARLDLYALCDDHGWLRPRRGSEGLTRDDRTLLDLAVDHAPPPGDEADAAYDELAWQTPPAYVDFVLEDLDVEPTPEHERWAAVVWQVFDDLRTAFDRLYETPRAVYASLRSGAPAAGSTLTITRLSWEDAYRAALEAPTP